MATSRHAARALFAATILWLATGVPATGAPLAAPFEGYDPVRPIETAAVELLRMVREQCETGPQILTIGTASVPVNEQAFTQDQGNHLMNAVHSALSRLPGVKMAPFRDIGAILEVQSAGMTETPNAGEVERLLGQVDIVVKATGQRVREIIKLRLEAIGRKGLQCFPSTPPVDVPPELAGEIYIPAENIFNKAARDLWENARGKNDVAVVSRTPTGASLEPQLPGYFTTLMRRAIADTRGQATQVIGNPTVLNVVSGDQITIGDQRWDADVIVEQRKGGIRISIDLTRPDANPIAAYGVVRAEDLPALDLQAVVLKGDRALSRQVSSLRFGPTPTRLKDRLDDRVRERRYQFVVEADSFVEFDVPIIDGPTDALPPAVVTATAGVEQKPINPPGSRVNLRRYRLEPGVYVVKIANPSRARVDFELRGRAAGASDMLEPEVPNGRLLRRFQDWYVGEVLPPPKSGRPRVCYVYTAAASVFPADWREQAPVIWMSAYDLAGLSPARRGEFEGLTHKLDDAPRYAPGGPLEASVDGPDGPRTLRVAAWNKTVVPSVAGADGGPTLDRDAVRGYTEGATLELQGVTADGRQSRIVYSLQGYRSAVNAMSLACGRRDLANDLVWR